MVFLSVVGLSRLRALLESAEASAWSVGVARPASRRSDRARSLAGSCIAVRLLASVNGGRDAGSGNKTP